MGDNSNKCVVCNGHVELTKIDTSSSEHHCDSCLKEYIKNQNLIY